MHSKAYQKVWKTQTQRAEEDRRIRQAIAHLQTVSQLQCDNLEDWSAEPSVQVLKYVGGVHYWRRNHGITE